MGVPEPIKEQRSRATNPNSNRSSIEGSWGHNFESVIEDVLGGNEEEKKSVKKTTSKLNS